MELSKVLLGALLIGIAVETTSCTKGNHLKVKPAKVETNGGETTGNHGGGDGGEGGGEPGCCPACGLG